MKMNGQKKYYSSTGNSCRSKVAHYRRMSNEIKQFVQKLPDVIISD